MDIPPDLLPWALSAPWAGVVALWLHLGFRHYRLPTYLLTSAVLVVLIVLWSRRLW